VSFAVRPEDDRPFTEPWQARAFAMAVVAAERMGVDWDEFRDRLKAAIAAGPPDRPYYEAWMDALQRLVDDMGDEARGRQGAPEPSSA
jgi:nitrile hydratase accessory protein